MSSMFDKQKASSLDGVDLSRKGSIDEPIQPLIGYINDQPNFFTTSSCSGRILIVDNAEDGQVKKKGCKWIMTSHTFVKSDSVIESLSQIEENAVFKFEPFVLHVQCRNLQAAQTMLQCGVASGFRNSGISVGNKGRFITAIRSTHSLEVPLSCQGKMLVSEEYMSFLVETSNQKMQENLNRIDRFFKNLKSSLSENTENHKSERKIKDKDKMFSKLNKKVLNESSETSHGTGGVNSKGDTVKNGRTDRTETEKEEEIDFCECLGFMDEG